MNRKPRGEEKSEPTLRAEIRARLASWPQERLLDFAVEQFMAEPERRHLLSGPAGARGAEVTLAGELRRAIDRAVDVQYVDWREVPGYIGRLERLLGDIRSFAEGYPREGVSVLKYFVNAIPRAFDSVSDEDELTLFCQNLSETALALASRVTGAAREMAEELLVAYVADEHDRFLDIPELLVDSELAADIRREVAAVAEALAIQLVRTDSHKSRELSSLVDRLR